MGSMLLPIGSPHNIFMYSVSGISFVSFIMLLLPYVIVSFIFLFILCFTVSKREITVPVIDEIDDNCLKDNVGNFFKKVFSGVDYFFTFNICCIFYFNWKLAKYAFYL